MKLLQTQKNDIFDIILDEGMNPSDFKFSVEFESRDEMVTYLKYKETKYYFQFRNIDDRHWITSYSPSGRSLEVTEKYFGGWKGYISITRKWLKHLKREVNATDKWEAFAKELHHIPFAFDSNNEGEKFSSDEIKLLDLKIQTVKKEIKKLELPKETIKQLNAKLDSLNEKVDKLSKTDWKELFLGAVISTIFNLAIPPDSGKSIWEIIRHTFKQYILP